MSFLTDKSSLSCFIVSEHLRNGKVLKFLQYSKCSHSSKWFSEYELFTHLFRLLMGFLTPSLQYCSSIVLKHSGWLCGISTLRGVLNICDSYFQSLFKRLTVEYVCVSKYMTTFVVVNSFVNNYALVKVKCYWSHLSLGFSVRRLKSWIFHAGTTLLYIDTSHTSSSSMPQLTTYNVQQAQTSILLFYVFWHYWANRFLRTPYFT